MGMFTTFTEANLRNLATRIARNEATSVEHMPSYGAAMRNVDLKHEVFFVDPAEVFRQPLDDDGR